MDNMESERKRERETKQFTLGTINIVTFKLKKYLFRFIF